MKDDLPFYFWHRYKNEETIEEEEEEENEIKDITLGNNLRVY